MFQGTWEQLLLLYGTALAGAASFAVVFRTPRRYVLHTVFIGFVSGVGIRMCPPAWPVGFATFLVAVAVASLSHLFARASRAPAQCFLIPGVIFLVPGTTIYRAFSAALAGAMADAGALALKAVTVTVGISFALLLANWVVPARKTL
jgi:uncharacterized membrane protein YjjB (DUF3815 family)